MPAGKVRARRVKPQITFLNPSPAKPTPTSNVKIAVDVGHALTPVPTGRVEFFYNSSVHAHRLLGSSTIKNGVARISARGLPVGQDQISARYLGDRNYAADLQGEYLNVGYETVITISARSANNHAFEPVVLTASLHGVGARTYPRGASVTFMSDQEPLGQAPLKRGSATLNTSAIGPGKHHLTVSFSDGLDFWGSTSKPAPLKLSLTNIIDLLVVYTAGATDVVASVPTAAQEAVANANKAFRNSHINAKLRLVGVDPVEYEESNSYDTDLTRLANPHDGFLDEVPKLRNQAGADLVSLFDGAPGSSAQGEASGLGYVMGHTNDPANPAFGYSVVLADLANFTLAHEIGHNLGAHHDDQNDASSVNIAPYDHGYRFTGQDHILYHDIMSYDPGQTIPYFANPNVLYENTPTGDPKTANLARLFNQTAPIVAAYRHAPKPRH